MRVRVTKAFKWSPDGNEQRSENEGSIIEGPAAVAALAMECGEPEEPIAAPTSPPDPKAQPTPENKAVASAPRNKSK